MVTVIGVTADFRSLSYSAASGMVVYLPLPAQFEKGFNVIAATSTDATSLSQRLREVVQNVEPQLAVADSGTVAMLAGPSIQPLRIAAALTGSLSLTALGLALVGLYGVLSHLIASRTRETGIRIALGATSAQILRAFMIEGLRPVAVGLLIAFTGAWAIGAALRPFFARVLPAVTYQQSLEVLFAFIGIGALACFVPAFRASRLDPSSALRKEA
jgi:ABC-type antimicrobial peptide transport system permease subunit